MSYGKVSRTSVLRYMYVMYLFRVTFVHRYRRPNDTTLNEHHVCPECKGCKPSYFRYKFSPLCDFSRESTGFSIFTGSSYGLDKRYMFCLCIYSIDYVLSIAA